jgi:hypothetical protein
MEELTTNSMSAVMRSRWCAKNFSKKGGARGPASMLWTQAHDEQLLEHLEHLGKAFDAVANWREMTSTSPLRCRPGSVLREDDRANPSSLRAR